ncbi:MAG: DUF362 domain-containing protein [Clostridiales bacterium]|nr:DUF362 domain-containing protein [Clostridiales bacterium]
MRTVSVRRAAGYEDDSIYRAVCAHFEALDVASELSPDSRVVLKPNLLAGRAPNLAVTTHPAFLRAITRRLRELGVRDIVLADSPGGVYTPAYLRKVYAACGMASLADVLTLNEDVTSGQRGGFSIIRPVLDADYVINCPKLKTHGLTVMSAAVKNLFGCIPGLQKPEWHCLRPTIEGFSEMLLDLSEAVQPNLTLVDALDCMEGNGPGGGKVRPMGYTLCSRSVYAVDEAAARLMALRPQMAPTLRLARAKGLSDPASLQLIGDELIPADPPFLLPDAIVTRERFFSVNGLFHHFFGRKRTYPVVVPENCIGCGKCAESCPKQIIAIVDRKAVISRKGCISCFCCQEMCPAHAIDVVRRRAW